MMSRPWTYLLAAALPLALLLFTIDPARADWFPKCPFHQATGLHCPGCGTMRAGHALLNGHPIIAIGLNPLGAATVLIAASATLTSALYPRWSGAIPRQTGWIVLGVILCYWVLRNLPYYPFTMLAP